MLQGFWKLLGRGASDTKVALVPAAVALAHPGPPRLRDIMPLLARHLQVRDVANIVGGYLGDVVMHDKGEALRAVFAQVVALRKALPEMGEDAPRVGRFLDACEVSANAVRNGHLHPAWFIEDVQRQLGRDAEEFATLLDVHVTLAKAVPEGHRGAAHALPIAIDRLARSAWPTQLGDWPHGGLLADAYYWARRSAEFLGRCVPPPAGCGLSSGFFYRLVGELREVGEGTVSCRAWYEGLGQEAGDLFVGRNSRDMPGIVRAYDSIATPHRELMQGKAYLACLPAANAPSFLDWIHPNYWAHGLPFQYARLLVEAVQVFLREDGLLDADDCYDDPLRSHFNETVSRNARDWMKYHTGQLREAQARRR